jgi:hypothetical protein
MRAKISKTRNLYGECWAININNTLEYFADFNTALHRLNKLIKRVYKEASAYSMARTISANLLSIDEGALVRKLCKSKCKGITPKQYGYLKGIHERQEREW